MSCCCEFIDRLCDDCATSAHGGGGSDDDERAMLVHALQNIANATTGYAGAASIANWHATDALARLRK